MFFNLGESLGDELINAYSGESIGRNNVGRVVMSDLFTKLSGFVPSGGGLLSGGAEVVTNRTTSTTRWVSIH